MKINFQKLEQNLQKYKVENLKTKNEQGIAKAIQYVWNHTATKNVNFDSFTLDDGLRAFYEFYTLPVYEDEPSDAEIAETRNSPWAVNQIVDDCIYCFAQNNKRVYQNEDDFI